MIASTATYIGLRTYRYHPLTINVRVGATGAGVPNPSIAKRRNESSTTISPHPIKKMPVQRAEKEPAICPPLITRGTNPATTPGAAKKNNTDPNDAVDLVINNL